MSSWLFNLNEEILENGTIESRCFIFSCIFILFLRLFSIISGLQFILLFVFYVFWFIITFSSIHKFDKIKDDINNMKKNIKSVILPSKEN